MERLTFDDWMDRAVVDARAKFHLRQSEGADRWDSKDERELYAFVQEEFIELAQEIWRVNPDPIRIQEEAVDLMCVASFLYIWGKRKEAETCDTCNGGFFVPVPSGLRILSSEDMIPCPDCGGSE